MCFVVVSGRTQYKLLQDGTNTHRRSSRKFDRQGLDKQQPAHPLYLMGALFLFYNIAQIINRYKQRHITFCSRYCKTKARGRATYSTPVICLNFRQKHLGLGHLRPTWASGYETKQVGVVPIPIPLLPFISLPDPIPIPLLPPPVTSSISGTTHLQACVGECSR